MTPITMIDYGGSNLRSAQKAFEHVGADVVVTGDPALVARAEKLVLPGVGAFGAGMDALHTRGLPDALRAAVARGIPLLGICLGMQFLFDRSDEMGDHAGLGLLPGRVTRFPLPGDPEPRRLVPHMGWNALQPTRAHPLLGDLAPGDHAYFVHSYYCAPADRATILATSEYGGPFAAIVGHGRIFGCQFHPEKSQGVGLRLLANFTHLTYP